MLDSLGDILRDHAHKLPDVTAIVHAGRRITFGQHFRRLSADRYVVDPAARALLVDLGSALMGAAQPLP